MGRARRTHETGERSCTKSLDAKPEWKIPIRRVRCTQEHSVIKLILNKSDNRMWPSQAAVRGGLL
jgi:hypothetical protein